MQVISVSPFQVASLTWQPSEGRYSLTVVAKATFELAQGHARLAETQEVPNERDNHWNDDPSLSLHSPSDLAPFKRKADVVLVGEAHAPGGKPVRSLVARLVVGSIDKAIEVVCDRHFTPQGELVEGKPFTRMPLRYERAAGPAHGNNPVGMSRKAERDRYGRLPIPNLVPPGATIHSLSDNVTPVGFGPIASSWPTRRALLGRHGGSWSEPWWASKPLPTDIDFAYFNVAPPDQRLETLHDTQRITLENLHPYEPRLVCDLPGFRPRVYVERRGAARDVPMQPDTLWIDTSRGICTHTRRGRHNHDTPDEPGRVYVAMEKPGVQLAWATVRQLAAVMGGVRDDETADSVDDEHTAIGVFPPGQGEALPFRDTNSTSSASGSRPPPPSTQAGGSTGMLALIATPGDRSPAWLRDPAQPTSSFPPPPEANAEPSPWARGPAPSDVSKTDPQAPVDVAAPPAPRLPPPPAAPALSPLGPAVRPPNPMQARHDVPASEPPLEGAPIHERILRARGANSDVVELLWYQDDQIDKIRSQPHWRELLDELARAASRPDEPIDFDEPPPPEPPPETRARRDIVGVLTRGHVTSAGGMQQTMLDAIDDGGHFDPPLVLVSGKLLFPFDPLETLKATLAAVAPLVAGNQELQATVDAVQELLSTPWLSEEGSGEIAEGLTDKVRNAFKRADRIVDPSYLDDHTERILLERRCYQRRTLFGGSWIRAWMTPASGRIKIPTYVPDALSKDLPMFKSFAARVIGQAHVQQDQYESHPTCLKVVAFGRVVNLTRGSAY